MSEQDPREVEATYVAPVSTVDDSLLKAFAQDVAAQATRMDDLAKQLISLGLAIPGIYGVVLKLTAGSEATLDNNLTMFLAFSCWLLALGLTWISLLPQRQQVDPESFSDIQHYFSKAAKRKLWLLVAASALQFFGICLAVFDLIL